MIRIAVTSFYNLGKTLEPLLGIEPEMTAGDVYFPLAMARLMLETVLTSPVIPLRTCQLDGNNLVKTLQKLTKKLGEGQELTQVDVVEMTEGLRRFEAVLMAELQVLDIYFISQQGIYSTPDLIEKAEMALDQNVRNTIPEKAVQDFRQAGRCLAFNLPTASGFHSMRATELVLRQWHGLVVSQPPAKPPEMAACIKDLKSAGADARTLEILDQIRDLHRNPLMHPEIFLEMNEAVRLFNITISAISAMADQIATTNPKVIKPKSNLSASTHKS